VENLASSSTVVPAAEQNVPPAVRQSLAFIALTFGISWPIWIAAHRLGSRPGVGEEILGFGSVGPAMAAIFLSRAGRKVVASSPTKRLFGFALLWPSCWLVYTLSDKMRGVTLHLSLFFGIAVALLAAISAWIGSGASSSDLGVRRLLRTFNVVGGWRWHAIALFSLPALLLVPTAILHMFGAPMVWQRGGKTLGALAIYGVFTFLRNLFFTAFFEEPGWRGYLLPCLQRRFSPFVASLLVWFPWALWHAPLDFSGGIGNNLRSYFQARVIFLIPIAIIITWIYNRSGGNLLSTSIFHAGMNTFPFVLPYAPPVLGLIFVWAGYAIFADKMWRKRATAGESPSFGDVAREPSGT
jgi:CAAX protease family protein